jgi:hypothetical protein
MDALSKRLLLTGSKEWGRRDFVTCDPPVFRPESAVTVASLLLETGTIQEYEPSPPSMKQAVLLHSPHRGCHACPANAKCAPEKLVGHRQLIPVNPVMSEQQPAGQPLL